MIEKSFKDLVKDFMFSIDVHLAILEAIGLSGSGGGRGPSATSLSPCSLG